MVEFAYPEFCTDIQNAKCRKKRSDNLDQNLVDENNPISDKNIKDSIESNYKMEISGGKYFAKRNNSPRWPISVLIWEKEQS